ncbi:MAG: phosphatidylglycerol lysyltransferase domain-containing protein, partial [Bacteroidota bacterium]
GQACVSLGLAPLSGRTGVMLTNPFWIRRLFDVLRTFGRPFYHFEGLDAFKAKFRPDRWVPQYAVVNERHIRPRLLYAFADAFLGGSPVPVLLKALKR